MCKVRIAFFISTKRLVNKLIAGWTWFKTPDTPPASHVEIGFFIDGKWKYYSSTNRGNAKGTRWIDEKDLFKHPERWVVYELERSEAFVWSAIDTADRLLGAKYDWWGIAGFVTVFGLLNSKKKWYCSEVCWRLLTGIWLRRIDPRRMLSRTVNELGAKKCLIELSNG